MSFLFDSNGCILVVYMRMFLIGWPAENNLSLSLINSGVPIKLIKLMQNKHLYSNIGNTFSDTV